jgi:hypothetical protein
MYGQCENQREDGTSGAPWKLLIFMVPEEGLEPSRGLTPPDFESFEYVHNYRLFQANLRKIM